MHRLPPRHGRIAWSTAALAGAALVAAAIAWLAVAGVAGGGAAALGGAADLFFAHGYAFPVLLAGVAAARTLRAAAPAWRRRVAIAAGLACAVGPAVGLLNGPFPHRDATIGLVGIALGGLLVGGVRGLVPLVTAPLLLAGILACMIGGTASSEAAWRLFAAGVTVLTVGVAGIGALLERVTR